MIVYSANKLLFTKKGMHMKTKKIILCLITLITPHSDYFACTGIRLKAKDDSIIYARTLEWRQNLNPHAIVVVNNTSYSGTSVNNEPGKPWTVKYTFTGITIGEHPYVIDGINKEGLAVGLFSFRDDVEYGLVNHDKSNDIAPWELPTYLLSTCATVEDVKNMINTINVVPVFLEDVNEVPPLHYIVHDAEGNCIVLEHYHQHITLHENSIGAITNSPNFDWHLTNLNNYLNHSFDDNKTSHLTNLKTLQESNTINLPSDFSSPARFVRAAVYSQCAPLPITGKKGVLQAFHILNQFDIPRGIVRSSLENYFTYTHWTSAANLMEKKYYFRTYDSQRIRMIDLLTISEENPHIYWISMNMDEDIDDITYGIKN